MVTSAQVGRLNDTHDSVIALSIARGVGLFSVHTEVNGVAIAGVSQIKGLEAPLDRHCSSCTEAFNI